MALRLLTIVTILATANLLPAQSFNVNFSAGSGPSGSYAGAGVEGSWNTILGMQSVRYGLFDTSGGETAVTVRNLGGTQLLAFDHPGTTGDDEALLDSYLVTRNQVETCLRFDNLRNGIYQVITYAWYSPDPKTRSKVTCDESTQPPVRIGGAWQGRPTIGTVFAVHLAQVTNGVLNSHSGLSGGRIAALNGIQVRRLTAADGLIGISVGGPYDVLAINGSTGVAPRGGVLRQVDVPVGQSITVEMRQPPTMATGAQFAVLGRVGIPGPAEQLVLASGMGTLLFPPWFFNPGGLPLFTMQASFLSALWNPVFSTGPTVASATIPVLPPMQFTLQPLVEETPGVFRVGNALVCNVQ